MHVPQYIVVQMISVVLRPFTHAVVNGRKVAGTCWKALVRPIEKGANSALPKDFPLAMAGPRFFVEPGGSGGFAIRSLGLTCFKMFQTF